MAISSRITLLGALALWVFQAQAVDVTVAYQTSAEPAKVAQADKTFEKTSGANVDWRKFDSGAAIVRALASGDVQIGNLGSSPLAVAAARAWGAERGESVEIEATGGLTLEVAADYGATGIDWMSVGGLTHSSPIVDLALDLV